MRLKSIKPKIKYLGIGILSSVALFLVFGAVTALIPNPWFNRMIDKTTLDYFFLITSSALLGAYIGVHSYKKNVSKKCNLAAGSGGVGGFLAFGCPICNKILVSLLGTATLLAYFEPYKQYLGFLSVGLLSGALYFKLKTKRRWFKK